MLTYVGNASRAGITARLNDHSGGKAGHLRSDC